MRAREQQRILLADQIREPGRKMTLGVHNHATLLEDANALGLHLLRLLCELDLALSSATAFWSLQEVSNLHCHDAGDSNWMSSDLDQPWQS